MELIFEVPVVRRKVEIHWLEHVWVVGIQSKASFRSRSSHISHMLSKDFLDL